MFHVKHSCVGASRSSFRVLHLVRRRRFAVPPPLRACSHWACRCSSGGRPWRWGERGTRGASVPVRSRGQRAMARGALDDGQPMRTSQSSSCGGGVAAWRCGGAAGQAPILSSGRPLSRPDRPRRSDWPDPIPSGYSFSLVSRSAGAVASGDVPMACRRRGWSGPPSFLLAVPFPARIDPVAVIGRIPSLPATPFSSFRASLGLVALGGAPARFALCLDWPLPAGHWSHARCSPPRGFDRGARMFHVKHWCGFDHWAATEESPAGKTPIFGKKSRVCNTIRRSPSVL